MRTPMSMVGSISLGVKQKQIQDRVIEAGSALLIIPLSKRRRERNALRREPPAANFPPKYNCSLISRALDSEAETTTNRFMRRTEEGVVLVLVVEREKRRR